MTKINKTIKTFKEDFKNNISTLYLSVFKGQFNPGNLRRSAKG